MYIFRKAAKSTAAGTLAERIRSAVESEQFDTAAPVTVSIRVTDMCSDHTDCVPVVSRAGNALYTAKDDGQNQVDRTR